MERRSSQSGRLLREESDGDSEVFSFIAAEKTTYPVAVMCRVFRQPHRLPQLGAPAVRCALERLYQKIKQIHAASRALRRRDPRRAAHRARIRSAQARRPYKAPYRYPEA